MEKILYIVEALVNEISGNNALRLLKELLYKQNVSEILLAEKLKLSVNEVRSTLYKLHAYNLVYSTRKKDKEKGWYIYYWSFNFHHARDILIMRKKKRLNKLEKSLDMHEHKDLYECKNNCIKVGLREAMGYNFKCPDCEQLLIHKDNSLYIENIKKEIEGVNKDLEILKQPIKVTIKKEETVKKKVVKKKVKKSKKVKKKVKKEVVKKVKKKSKVKKKKVIKKKVVKNKGVKKVKKKTVKKIKKKVKKVVKKKVVKKVKPKQKKVVKKVETVKKKKGFFGKLKRKIKF